MLLLCARALRLPSSLRDAATGEYLPAYRLEFPAGYLLSAPLSSFADMLTYASARQDKVLVAYLLLGFWIPWAFLGPRSWKRAGACYALYLCGVLAFLAWAVLLPRPCARLRLPDPDLLALDFHSHTSRSWDGRRSFGPEANMEWHRRSGYDAAFITDHNAMDASLRAQELSRRGWRPGGFRSLAGEELSLQDTHVAMLGNRSRIDNAAYDASLPGVFRLLREAAPRHGGLAVMSLPEYWLRHPSSRWEQFAAHGAAGFEIVNAAPKSLDFPERLRREIVALCRRRNLFLAGASDSHGWGSAAYVWNILRIEGHASLDPDRLQRAVLDHLREKGFGAVRVVTRVKHEPSPFPWVLLDPAAGLWTMARTFTGVQTLSCLAWIWGLFLIIRVRTGPWA